MARFPSNIQSVQLSYSAQIVGQGLASVMGPVQPGARHFPLIQFRFRVNFWQSVQYDHSDQSSKYGQSVFVHGFVS